MKHPDDRYTLELIPAAVKRGRGRPRKANALTPADRARRYRQRQSKLRQMRAEIKSIEKMLGLMRPVTSS